MIKKMIISGILVLCLSGIGFIRAEEEAKKTVAVKELQGEVSGISSNFIAILYGQDKETSYEMALTVDKDTKVEHKKSLKEIGPRDTVSVKYEETTQTHKEKTEKGEEKDVTKVLGRVAKVISFIKAAPKELQSFEENELLVPAQPEPQEQPQEQLGQEEEPLVSK